MVGEDDGCALERCKTAGTGGAGELMQQAVAEGPVSASDRSQRVSPGGKVRRWGVGTSTAQALPTKPERQVGPTGDESRQRGVGGGLNLQELRQATEDAVVMLGCDCCGEGGRKDPQHILCPGARAVEQQKPGYL